MKSFLASAALAVAVLLPAISDAADLPKTAKAPSLAYPTTKCGFYYGVNTTGSTGAVSTGQVGAQVVQGAIGLTVGYTCPVGPFYWFADGDFDFSNLNGNANGLALSGPAFFEQRFGFGAPVDMIMSLIPGLTSLQNAVPSLIPLPAGVAVTTSNPYVFGSLSEQDTSAMFGFAQNRQWLIAPGIGIGTKVRLSNGVVFDPYAEYVLNSNAMCFGPLGGNSCVKQNTQVRVGAKIEF